MVNKHWRMWFRSTPYPSASLPSVSAGPIFYLKKKRFISQNVVQYAITTYSTQYLGTGSSRSNVGAHILVALTSAPVLMRARTSFNFRLTLTRVAGAKLNAWRTCFNIRPYQYAYSLRNLILFCSYSILPTVQSLYTVTQCAARLIELIRYIYVEQVTH